MNDPSPLTRRRFLSITGQAATTLAAASSFVPAILSAEPPAKPLQVFILAGQSNMQGHAHVSTFDYLADDPETAPILKEMRHADGTPRVCERVWISSVGCAGDGWSEVIEQKGKLTAGFGASPEKIGPEFTFGIHLKKTLGGPVLIIKTAWGGRSLHTDFRPPSAGPYVWGDYELARRQERREDVEKQKAEKLKDTGVFYRHMIEHVRKVLADIKRVVPEYDPQQGYELAGFVWFQGWNDLVSTWTYPQNNYDEYGRLLTMFIRDVRQDFNAPKLPFIIGVMGVDGAKPNAGIAAFREAMAAPAALPEFQGNVVAVQTAPFWSEELGAIAAKRERVSQMAYFLRTKHKDHANKDGTMTDEQQREYVKKYEAKILTPAEAALWKRGASNAGYHYLGCAKTFALMGRAFAEANLKLLESQHR